MTINMEFSLEYRIERLEKKVNALLAWNKDVFKALMVYLKDLEEVAK